MSLDVTFVFFMATQIVFNAIILIAIIRKG